VSDRRQAGLCSDCGVFSWWPVASIFPTGQTPQRSSMDKEDSPQRSIPGALSSARLYIQSTSTSCYTENSDLRRTKSPWAHECWPGDHTCGFVVTPGSSHPTIIVNPDHSSPDVQNLWPLAPGPGMLSTPCTSPPPFLLMGLLWLTLAPRASSGLPAMLSLATCAFHEPEPEKATRGLYVLHVFSQPWTF
jgi:hypothetical protein